jgi:hypothetical protein
MRIGLEAALSKAGFALAEALKEDETIDEAELLATLLNHTTYSLRGFGLRFEEEGAVLIVKRIVNPPKKEGEG